MMSSCIGLATGLGKTPTPQKMMRWVAMKTTAIAPEKNLIFVVCSLCAQALESEFIPTSILNVKIQRMQGDQASPSCPVLPCPV